jgi:hypothetical protein
MAPSERKARRASSIGVRAELNCADTYIDRVGRVSKHLFRRRSEPLTEEQYLLSDVPLVLPLSQLSHLHCANKIKGNDAPPAGTCLAALRAIAQTVRYRGRGK